MFRVNINIAQKGAPLTSILERAFAGDGTLTVGIPSGIRVRRNNGSTVELWKVAMWLEYGVASIGLEPRPAVTKAINNNEGKYIRSLRSRVRLVKQGRQSPEVALSRLGAMIVKDIVHSIDIWKYPPNKETQKRLKGHDNPLKHTGRLRKSFTYSVSLTPSKIRKTQAWRMARSIDTSNLNTRGGRLL